MIHLPQVGYPFVRLLPRPRPAVLSSVCVFGLLFAAVPANLIGQVPNERPATVTEDERENVQATRQATPGAKALTPEELGLVPGRPRVTPTRTENPPVIDGVLDDVVWQSAAHITEFTQASPIDGAPATEATDVYVAYDSEYVYFGFHAHYQDPAIMRANRVERDRSSQ